jgi:polar amino acid transport system substrate-binding protein
MKLPKWTWLIAAAALSACATVPDDEVSAARKQLAPTGKLRVGIVISSVASAFFVARDTTTGVPQGVTVDLGSALAEKLGVPVELFSYPSPRALNESATTGAWDVTFMPIDPEREKLVDFGPSYVLFESGYVVPPGSTIPGLTAVDKPGVRVVAVRGTAPALQLSQLLKSATLLRAETLEEAYDMARSGKAEVVAGGRTRLLALTAQFPDARLLEGSYASSGIAIAVPKHRAETLKYASDFIEEAKASGLVQRAFDSAGIREPVAPPRHRR